MESVHLTEKVEEMKSKAKKAAKTTSATRKKGVKGSTPKRIRQRVASTPIEKAQMGGQRLIGTVDKFTKKFLFNIFENVGHRFEKFGFKSDHTGN